MANLQDMPRLSLLFLLLLSIPAVSSLVAHTFKKQIICGRPCLVVPSKSQLLFPTLIVLGGIAQTTSSWEHQLQSLSRNRNVIVYECLGQGRVDNDDSKANVFANVTLPFQAELFLSVLDEIVGQEERVDIAGFSFGGRVAMATACLQPKRIRKLHLTGVGCDRSDYGHLAMDACKDALHFDSSLRAFAWTILLATYSPSYLRQLPTESRERFLNFICSTNSREGLMAILDQAEVKDLTDPYHVSSMGDRLGLKIISKLCVGELDHMAPVDQVRLLQENLGSQDVDVVPNCGHAVAVENARAWKDSVLSFFDQP
ncbi:alpha/beta fold family hydrolase [Nitzschia inconspicua]|uniref:Alpha/beta fold family hydrolase n=1 Tax=Nitzschia inconspicua TaxID=303405 RepID=A0A9K3K883_9STRA|nr:alpha/beta fold family hydrolase [Nitzschia inconspicua]KAG7367077.1 alpha/beta fold family hydrolase [Nitzschia inconspicua]